jgi:hypothetical protein
MPVAELALRHPMKSLSGEGALDPWSLGEEASSLHGKTILGQTVQAPSSGFIVYGAAVLPATCHHRSDLLIRYNPENN